MELLNYLNQVPLPVLILVIAALAVLTVVIAYQYAKMKGLEGIRENVYQLNISIRNLARVNRN